MKKNILFILLLALALNAFCQYDQDTVRYPYSCYMEWPMDTMSTHYNSCERRSGTYHVVGESRSVTLAREFAVDTPTTLYGIAITLWGQDTAQRDIVASLFSYHGDTAAHLIKAVRWFDSMPYRYFAYEAKRCFHYSDSDTNYGKHFEETIKAYEFYFDKPVVVTDTFLVGYHTLGVDGRQHPFFDNWSQRDSGGYAYLATQYTPCVLAEYGPTWHWVLDTLLLGTSGLQAWGGVLPIIEPQCNPDTLTCAAVPDFNAHLADSVTIECNWYALPSQQHLQVSIGLEGNPPDDNPLYDVDSEPFSVTGNWTPGATYAAYIRTQCTLLCNHTETLVWSDWSEPTLITIPNTTDTTDTTHTTQGIVLPPNNAPRFTLTPNPARKQVTVQVENGEWRMESGVFHKAELVLRDAAGHEVLRHTLRSPLTALPVEKLPAGVYFATLYWNGSPASTQRLVLER